MHQEKKMKVADRTETLKMFIGGEWTASEAGEAFEATSPASGDVIARIPKGTRADASRAVEAAHRARAAMASLGAFERAQLLHRIADTMEVRREELARWLTLDQGKPHKAEAVGEVGEAIEYFRIAAEDIKRLETNVIPSASKNKLVFTLRVPRGVYGVITPWNWPLTMATEVIAPALAGGNTVVWAPATSTSAISVKLMECLAEADLPDGAVNLVTGPGSVVGDEVAGHPLIAGVGFVGSTETGRSVARRAAGKHLMLELGGNGPIVIFDDADVARAVEGTVTGCFLCAGQSCTAGERILVQKGIEAEFTEALTSAVKAIKLGDPFDESTTMGPLNNEGVAAKMDEHVRDALEHGAQAVTGGRRASNFPTRLYYEATVLRGVDPKMRVSREETFGPIAPLIQFKDEADALAIANDSPYGLLGSVYTRDIDRALRFARAMETGWVNVNESSNYWEAHIPFGGRAGKESGIGRVGGHGAIEQMTDLKTIIIDIKET
jgi:succinate-semialdehyde dehydrogenase/glutarate-semialdehyde dehydrogenase